jgi:hypothetical protein
MSRDIPIVIPTYNNYDYLSEFLIQLESINVKDIVILDNNSSDDKLLDFLESNTNKYRVIRLNYNYGPRYVLHSKRIRSILPDKILLSDPDIKINSSLPINFLEEFIELSLRYRVGKVGSAISLSEKGVQIEKRIVVDKVAYSVFEWEKKFWNHKLGTLISGDPYYKADIDTTFTLVNFDFFEIDNELNGIRVAGNYEVIHIPWTENSSASSEERLDTGDRKPFSSWSNAITFIGNDFEKEILNMKNELVKLRLEKSLEKIRKENALDENLLLHRFLNDIALSRSWRITRPLRILKHKMFKNVNSKCSQLIDFKKFSQNTRNQKRNSN